MCLKMWTPREIRGRVVGKHAVNVFPPVDNMCGDVKVALLDWLINCTQKNMK